MTRILVTGGAGFIGSHLVDELIKRKYDVYVLDNHYPGFGEEHTKAKIINGSVTRLDTLRFATSNIDTVVHLAALSHVSKCYRDPLTCMEVNAQGTINLLEACRMNDVEKVIVAGTDHIYGHDPEIPITEEHPHNGLYTDAYAISKVMAVASTQLYHNDYGLNTVVSVSGNVFSERQKSPNAIPNFIKCASVGREITIHGLGNQTRDFYHVDNLVDGYIKCIETNGISGEIFNFGSETEISIANLAYKIKEMMDSTSVIRFTPENKSIGMKRMLLDTTKAQKMLGFKIIVPFEEGLRRTIEGIKLRLKENQV